MSGAVPRRSSGNQSIVSLRARSSPRVNVRSVPGIFTMALSSAGRAVGGGGAPGTGGVYAHSGRPGGMGPAGAGVFCCAITEAQRITTAIASSPPTVLPMAVLLAGVTETREAMPDRADADGEPMPRGRQEPKLTSQNPFHRVNGQGGAYDAA